MNIFAVHQDPVVAAGMLPDPHVVKMILESAQIASTVLRGEGREDAFLYKATHARHPCVKWAARSRANLAWVVVHGLGLAAEYNRRFGREHKTRAVLAAIGELLAEGVPLASWIESSWQTAEPFTLAMPDEYKRADPIESYRLYMRSEKNHLARWRAPGHRPYWWPEES